VAEKDDGKKAKGPMTETTVRQFDADGDLVSVVTTTVIREDPKADAEWPGQYL
jgi:riboflavin biosynthesis pyrimidine reductase